MNECCWDFEFWIWLKFPMWICSILDAICGTLFKCTWLGSLSMPSPCGASSSYMIDMMLKFYFFLEDPRLQDFSCFLMAGGWTIPTLDSSAFVLFCSFLFFLFFQLTVTNFTHQGQICFYKESLCEGNWWLLDGCWGIQLGFELPAEIFICIFCSKLFRLFLTRCILYSDVYLHDMTMTGEWMIPTLGFRVCVCVRVWFFIFYFL